MLKITTKYNIIYLEEKNFTEEQLKEILNQPYVIKVEKEKCKIRSKKK